VYKQNPKYGGHRNKISDMAFSEKSGLFATSGYDHLIKIWSLNSFSLLFTFDHSAVVYRLLPVGYNYLLSYGDDQQIKMWDYKNGLLVNTLNSFATNFEVSIQNSNFMFSYPTTTTRIIWPTFRPQEFTSTTTKPPMPNYLSYNLITFSKSDNLIKVWTLVNISVDSTLNSESYLRNDSIVKQLVIGDLYLCTAHQNEEIRLWSLQTKTLITTMDNETSGFFDGVKSLELVGYEWVVASRLKALGDDGGKLYSIKIWDSFDNFQLKYEFNSSDGNYFSDPSFTYILDGYLWIKDGSMLNFIWDIANQVYENLTIEEGDSFGKILDVDGTHYASLVKNSVRNTVNVRIFNSTNVKNYVKQFFVYGENFNGDFFILDYQYIAVTFGPFDFRIMILSVNYDWRKCVIASNSHTNKINTIISVNNGMFASGGDDAVIKIWNLDKCSLVYTFDNYEDSLANDRIKRLVSVDGFFLASIPESSAIKIWNLYNLTFYYRYDWTFGNYYFDLEYYVVFKDYLSLQQN
jgi:WD40 repeat protein